MMNQNILKISVLVDDGGSLTTQPADYWNYILHEAEGVIIMFNDNDRSSFESIPVWLRFIAAILDYSLPILFVCNRAELPSQVSKEEVQGLVEKYGLQILYTNSQTEGNVQEIFTRIKTMCEEFSFAQSLKPEHW